MKQTKSIPQTETVKFHHVIYTGAIQHQDSEDFPIEEWVGDATLRDESSSFSKYFRVQTLKKADIYLSQTDK